MNKKNFTHTTFIRLRDTDATGVLYFADQLKIALEVLEAFLRTSGMPLKQILEKEPYFLPVVHAEANYFAPLMVGDEIQITLIIDHIGESSFTCHYQFFDINRKLDVGNVTLVHVSVSKETRTKIPLPASLLKIIS